MHCLILYKPYMVIYYLKTPVVLLLLYSLEHVRVLLDDVKPHRC